MIMAAVNRLKKPTEPFDLNVLMKPTITVMVINIVYWLLHLMLSMYTVYLSFVRNGGLAIGPLIAAFCYPICYLVYHLAVPV